MKVNKKLLIIASLIFGLPLSVFAFLKIIGFVHFFNIPTPGNEPTIKAGSYALGTILKEPRPFDFVVYSQSVPEYPEGLWTHRLCGMEGDSIAIKNGVLYVNGSNVDQRLSLNHQYILEKDFASDLIKKGILQTDDVVKGQLDSVVVNISDELAKKHPHEIIRDIDADSNNYIFEHYGKHWNEDNFGPISVPDGHVFLLGDNRNFSYDSRFFGFMEKERIVAVLLFK